MDFEGGDDRGACLKEAVWSWRYSVGREIGMQLGEFHGVEIGIGEGG